MPSKNPKTPTESIKLDDIWEGFKSDYLPFVEWLTDPEGIIFCLVRFEENNPTKYTNKWSREQFKISVLQDEQQKVLSAGKKLFMKLKNFCIAENQLPTDLGIVQIDRIGSGFETDYKIQKFKKQSNLTP